jgi:hypothetical protein
VLVSRRARGRRVGERFRLNVVLQDYGPDGAGHSYEWRPSRFGLPSTGDPRRWHVVKME